MENTSGKGEKAAVPSEVAGWSWGAFLLHGIWGIGNRTYVALLAFVPIINIFAIIMLGLFGRKWAWKNKRWESIEHFKSVQRKWDRAGFAVLAIYIFFLVKGGISLL